MTAKAQDQPAHLDLQAAAAVVAAAYQTEESEAESPTDQQVDNLLAPLWADEEYSLLDGEWDGEWPAIYGAWAAPYNGLSVGLDSDRLTFRLQSSDVTDAQREVFYSNRGVCASFAATRTDDGMKAEATPYLTPDQARELAIDLVKAAEEYERMQGD